jgi:hypothetical protein
LQRACQCWDAHPFINNSQNSYNFAVNQAASPDCCFFEREQKGGALIKLRAFIDHSASSETPAFRLIPGRAITAGHADGLR